jgi:hypothetical protein
MYLAEFLVLGALSYFLADRFNRFAHRFSKARAVDRITFLIFVSLAGISFISPYFILQSWPGVVPPFLEGDSVPRPPLVKTQLEEDLDRVAAAAEELNRAMNDPGNMTIKDMQKLMTKTLENIDILRKKIEEQQRQYAELASRVRVERRRAKEAQEQANQISSLTRGQINAMKIMLTEDAQDAAEKSFLYGVAVSFPIGILSSIIASMLYKKRR